MARRPRPTLAQVEVDILKAQMSQAHARRAAAERSRDAAFAAAAQVDDLLAQVSQAHALRAAAWRSRDAALAEARDFGRRQIQLRRSLEQYVEALHDFNAGRQRLVGRGVDPEPDRFGGPTGPDPVGIPQDQRLRDDGVEVFGGTPTPNNPEPKLRWYQRRRREA